MKYCTSCGEQILEGARFCPLCGKEIGDSGNNGARKVTYEGELRKCPACGELLRSFESNCPACGHELRGVKNCSSVSELARKLEKATSERQRILIIKNFPVPNTREDIFEFMLLAASNFDSAYYVAHLDEEDISDAWLSKIEQCYQKASLSFCEYPDFRRIEDIYLRIKTDCAEKEHRFRAKEKSRIAARERDETARGFKKSKLRIVIIVFSVISALCVAVSFNDGRILSGIIAIAMFVLFVTSFLMGFGVIREKVRNMRLLPLILAFVLFIPYFSTYSNKSGSSHATLKEIETIEWNNLVIGSELPDYGKTEAEVVWDNDRSLILYFYNQTKSDFKNYVDSCKNFGYNIDIEDDGTNFTAYNPKGYYLHLQWLDWGDKKLTIDLESPKEKKQIIWPNSALVKDIPIPDHLIGEVSTEYDTSYSVYLVGVEESYFTEYVSNCMSNGFNIDYSKSKTYFHGENSSGISITVEYVGFNTLYIWISD